MDVVGIDRSDWDDDHVHTIDMWYSQRGRCWIIERLNQHGVLVGNAHSCASFDDAEVCVSDWLRSHAEAHLVAAREPLRAAEKAALERLTLDVANRKREQRRRAA